MELLVRTRLVKEDAAIGLVFPVLFSVAVILISRYARGVHLDVDAVLLGELAGGRGRQALRAAVQPDRHVIREPREDAPPQVRLVRGGGIERSGHRRGSNRRPRNRSRQTAQLQMLLGGSDFQAEDRGGSEVQSSVASSASATS